MAKNIGGGGGGGGGDVFAPSVYIISNTIVFSMFRALVIFFLLVSCF